MKRIKIHNFAQIFSITKVVFVNFDAKFHGVGASLRPFIRKVATKAAADATAGTKASHLGDWTFLATEVKNLTSFGLK